MSKSSGKYRLFRVRAAVILSVVCISGCVTELQSTLIQPADLRTVDDRAAFLKAHMADGSAYVFSHWEIDEPEQSVSGAAIHQDHNRRIMRDGRLTVPIDSVLIFESNVVQTSPTVAALAIITGLSAAATVYCLANPKACFGSCPTFYAYDGDSLRLQAEGFSASISPALEARDVDALYRVSPQSTRFTVEMRNEAYETHVTRRVDLLAVRKPPGGRVLSDITDRFFEATAFYEPLTCTGPEGPCLDGIREFDGNERFSLADSTDLAAKEEIRLTLDVPEPGRYGIAIAARQTLLSTYLLYQALAYMGNDAGRWLAMIERRDDRLKGVSVADVLGGLEVHVIGTDGSVRKAGAVTEHGPLATDVHLIHLGGLDAGRQELLLWMTKGNWRIDYIALVKLGDEVEPLRLPPAEVRRHGVLDHQAQARLTDPDAQLVSLPGDEYQLVYKLPVDFSSYELFLDSKGYYLEWMREEWIDEQNASKLAALIFSPEAMLKLLAPAYKAREAGMEAAFWNSKFADREATP